MSGWIDGGVRDRSGGGFSGLSAEANGFVPSNFSAGASSTSSAPSNPSVGAGGEDSVGAGVGGQAQQVCLGLI